MERITIKLDLSHAVDGKGMEVKDYYAQRLAHYCRHSNEGYDCTVGYLSCPLGNSSRHSCYDVTPEDWLKLLEVEK